MRFEGQVFEGKTVVLDFNEFESCVFHRCKVIYHGHSGTAIEGCEFRNVEWSVEGPAALTLTFLKMLHGSGGGLQELVEATLNNIRTGIDRPGGLVH